MSTYAIGDVQGCHDELRELLDRLRFDPGSDRVWFTGDLVNRGPKSLDTLRFVRGLGDSARTVLGNHDLHLLAVGLGARIRPKDTFQDVLRAPERGELLAWLRGLPLVHHDPGRDALMVHAGLAPEWDVAGALAAARDTEAFLRSPQADRFLRDEMYGNEPVRWLPSLPERDRHRFVINCCTRLRFCARDGRADFSRKGDPGSAPAGLQPWFSVPGRRSACTTVLFGHWSLLGQVHWPEYGVYGLDTGCVWGKQLTALCLETGELTQVESRQ